jgi:excinuclease ABC subunit C
MKESAFDIEGFLTKVPREPGCYLMKNHAGDIVYIGKARNLRSRLSSYFGKTSDTRYFVKLLDKVLGDIDTILCSNDKEAVILENELIKKHQPRYNVELKDDKSFLHIRIDRSQPFPRLEVIRRPRKKDRAVLFGPYHSASAIRNTMRIVNRHFSLRTCPDNVFKNRSRPCLEYQIQRCPGPCVLPYPEEKYAEHIDDVVLFLSGKTGDLLKTLKRKMKDASGQMNYEVAAHHRDQIHAIEKSLTQQGVFLKQPVDMDVIGLYREGSLSTVQLLIVRNGNLVGSRGFSLGRLELPDTEVLYGFIQQHYAKTPDIPKEVVLPTRMDLGGGLAAWLSEKCGQKVRVHTPSHGSKHKLVAMPSKVSFSSRRTRMKPSPPWKGSKESSTSKTSPPELNASISRTFREKNPSQARSVSWTEKARKRNTGTTESGLGMSQMTSG